MKEAGRQMTIMFSELEKSAAGGLTEKWIKALVRWVYQALFETWPCGGEEKKANEGNLSGGTHLPFVAGRLMA